ncbi:nucleobase:cation symporter-2 family protein [Streptomyces iconiensis]|uniref:Nucleobase:cation symporter-2 family protein n=1 Tax=Streptomyces iconiensis TaxID=1384038 RepID=A0ABT7A8R5_9ACTN|nr:nucleobase:cation symporter-2 family protein [Streptomyces iconiensis]MDJ1137735.1 nucleobase:cation symporter-2 family protein [Streptomyces iconiensis]
MARTSSGSHPSSGTPPGAAVRERDPVEEVPSVWRLGVYGLQHVLAFYAGAVVMPLLVAKGIGMPAQDIGYLINASLLTCGIATLLQSVGLPGIGIRLPVVQGTSTAAVPTLVSVGIAAGGARAGLPTVFGAVIAAGLALFLIAPVFSKLVRFFPPLVTGTIVTIIGITLLAVAAQQVGGGDPEARGFGSPEHLGLAGVTLVVILLLHKVSRGFLATVAVLLGLLVGTLVATAAGKADFSGIGEASWFGLLSPMHYGAPRWDTVAVMSVMLVMVIIAVESVGQFFAVGEVVERKVEKKHLTRALRADGLATAIAGWLNSFPSTVYSQNIGLLRLTRIKSRWIVASAGAIMMLLGLMPKVGALIAAMPASVLGGATIVLFSTIAVVGVQILVQADLHDQRNTIVVAASVGIGFLPTAFPQFAEQMPGQQLHALFESGIVLGTLSAVFLNVFFHHMKLPGRLRARSALHAPGAASRDPEPTGHDPGAVEASRGVDAPGDYMQHEIHAKDAPHQGA